jgi:hypothetical protein
MWKSVVMFISTLNELGMFYMNVSFKVPVAVEIMLCILRQDTMLLSSRLGW